MSQGRGTGQVEEERRRKISEARQRREAIRRGEIEPPPEEIELSDEMVRRSSHSIEEIRSLEESEGLIYTQSLVVGGKFLYEYKDSNWNTRSTIEDAGMKMRVPVFRRRPE